MADDFDVDALLEAPYQKEKEVSLDFWAGDPRFMDKIEWQGIISLLKRN